MHDHNKCPVAFPDLDNYKMSNARDSEVAQNDQLEEEIREFTAIKLDKKDLKAMKESGDTTFDKDLQEVMEAIQQFVDSKVLQAEKMLRVKCGKTMHHTHGTGVLAMLKALMTVATSELILV
jgi:hypothetical protein